MNIQIRLRDLDGNALRAHARRRVHLHLSRFGRLVRAAVVRVEDVNGPRGGSDKRCQVTVVGPRIGTTSVEQLHSDPYAAVELALERSARAVGRSIERSRAERRVPADARLAI